jgi:hypothetical protein
MAMVNPIITAPQKASGLHFLAAIGQQSRMRSFTETVAKLASGELHSEESILHDLSLKLYKEKTLVLVLEPNEKTPCVSVCCATVLNGGRVYPIVVEGQTIYLGPRRSALARNACPRCLQLRVHQWKNSGGETPQEDGPQSWTDQHMLSICKIVASVIRYKLCFPENTMNERCWMLKTNSLEAGSMHVVKTPYCDLCQELDAVSKKFLEKEPFK